MSTHTITFVTGNARKLDEVQAILWTVDSIVHRDLDLPELQGEPHDIAVAKCRYAAKKVGGPVLTEDVSLCFHALGGMPGPYIKWFLIKAGNKGLYKMLADFPDKSAHALCLFCYCAGPGEPVHTFEGRTEGRIVSPRGPQHFGWDPIFEPEGFDKTYAELPSEVKNVISHRRRALYKVHHFLP